ncbi:MAG: diadenylate cyclase [Candidatus Adiutrix sp.]|jgi:hypothetical protein|nr:diadenylate cyclase [Candidatus Adiutrix sp.]
MGEGLEKYFDQEFSSSGDSSVPPLSLSEKTKEHSASPLSTTRRHLKNFISQYLKIIWETPIFDLSLVCHSAWPRGSRWSLASLKYPLEIFHSLGENGGGPDLSASFYSRHSESVMDFLRLKEICEEFDSEFQVVDLSPLDWGDAVVFPIMAFRRADLAALRILNSESDLDLFEIDSFFQALLKSLDQHLAGQAFDLNLPMTLDPGRIDFLQAQAAESFLERVAGTPEVLDAESLFSNINLVSSMQYERRDNNSYILLVPRHFPDLSFNCKFQEPIKINAYRKFRKLLETTSHKNLLITDGSYILGTGTVADSYDPRQDKVFQISILGHLTWTLSCNGDNLLTYDHGKISERHKVLDRTKFLSTFNRVLDMEEDKIWSILRMLETLTDEKQGTTLIFSDNAAKEAARLKSEGFAVIPFEVTAENVAAYSVIDGAVLLDQDCRCHAFGVILDGDSIGDKADASRGARYNSALRYFEKRRSCGDRLCLVILSDDGMLDIVPILKPKVKRSRIDALMIRLMNITSQGEIDLDQYFDCLFELKQFDFCLPPDVLALIDEGLEKSLEPGDGYFQIDPLSRVGLTGLELLTHDPDTGESFFLDDHEQWIESGHMDETDG